MYESYIRGVLHIHFGSHIIAIVDRYLGRYWTIIRISGHADYHVDHYLDHYPDCILLLLSDRNLSRTKFEI